MLNSLYHLASYISHQTSLLLIATSFRF